MIRRLAFIVVLLFAAACTSGADSASYYSGFDETLNRELAAFPPDRALVVGTNLWMPAGYAKKFNRPLTLVNVGEERLVSFYRLDGYIAVNIPDKDNPVPYGQPRENPGQMLLKYGEQPLRAGEKFRWVDLRRHFETESSRGLSLVMRRLVAVDETKGLELAFRPWISLPETWITIAGKSATAHELLQFGRPRMEVITHVDTLSLRYTRPNPLFSLARLFTRAYPALLGKFRENPLTGMAVWMDQRRGPFTCPPPENKVQYCSYEEFHAQ